MKKNLFLLRNSVKNISRYRSRYILFGILFFITAIALSLSLSVFSNGGVVLETYMMEFFATYRAGHTPQFPTGVDRMSAFEKEYFLSFLDNQYVTELSFVNYRFSTALIHGTVYTSPNYRLPPEILVQYPDATPVLPAQLAYLSVELRTKSGTKSLTDFFYNPVYVIGLDLEELNPSDKKQFVLSKGRMYENDNECIIAVSSKIPDEEWNLLDVGDTIAMSTAENTYKEFIVVGVLRDNTDLSEGDQTRVLFTTFDSALFFKGSITSSVGFLLNPGVMPPTRSGQVNTPINFLPYNPYGQREEYYEKFEGYTVLIRIKSYEYNNAFLSEKDPDYGVSSISPDDATHVMRMVLQDSQSQRMMYIWIIAGFIVAVIATMTIMILSNRKYEIAVLRSVGMKKSRLILSYLTENLTFIWGLAVVALILAQTAYYLFLNQGLTDGVYARFMPDSPWPLILQNVGITFGGVTAVAVLSLIFAAIYIVRFEPLKIFNKRH